MGITPIGVHKRIKDIIDGVYDADEGKKQLKAAQAHSKYEAMPEKDLEKELKRLEKDMLDAAKNLEFEKAAELRDRLYQLKEKLFGVAPGPVAGFPPSGTTGVLRTLVPPWSSAFLPPKRRPIRTATTTRCWCCRAAVRSVPIRRASTRRCPKRASRRIG